MRCSTRNSPWAFIIPHASMTLQKPSALYRKTQIFTKTSQEWTHENWSLGSCWQTIGLCIAYSKVILCSWTTITIQNFQFLLNLFPVSKLRSLRRVMLPFCKVSRGFGDTWQRCTGAGVSEWTPAGVLTNFENRSGAGLDFLRKGRSGAGAVFWIWP